MGQFVWYHPLAVTVVYVIDIVRSKYALRGIKHQIRPTEEAPE
jgi:hypothetical protein